MRDFKTYIKDEGVFGYNYWFIIKNPWIIFPEAYRRTKWFIQRGRRGWSDCDAWSIDYYISRIMIGMLEAQYTDPQGTPAVLCKDWGEKSTPAEDKQAYERWCAILYDIKQGFKAHIAICDLDYFKSSDIKGSRKREIALWKTQKKGMALFVKYFPNLWN